MQHLYLYPDTAKWTLDYYVAPWSVGSSCRRILRIFLEFGTVWWRRRSFEPHACNGFCSSLLPDEGYCYATFDSNPSKASLCDHYFLCCHFSGATQHTWMDLTNLRTRL